MKTLEDMSSVTKDCTMIYQAMLLNWLWLELHCGIIGIKYSQFSNVGLYCEIIGRHIFRHQRLHNDIPRYILLYHWAGYDWNIIVVLLEQNVHKFPMLDYTVKLLEIISSVTKDSTIIYQALKR